VLIVRHVAIASHSVVGQYSTRDAFPAQFLVKCNRTNAIELFVRSGTTLAPSEPAFFVSPQADPERRIDASIN
jgi:hypothetical protein